MSEYAFFYNTSVQRPCLQAKHISDGTSKQKIKSTSSSPAKVQDHDMLGTSYSPLINYKHSANQSNKARARSTISGDRSSADRKNDGKTSLVAVNRASSSTTASSGRTAVSWSDPPSHNELMERPFTRRNGRKYLRDATLAYPLPCDLQEIHRQTLRTMLLCQVFDGPICAPSFKHNKPPQRVLDLGCGTGFWSVKCHEHFKRRGFSSISFTGIDIAPLAPRLNTGDDMNWKFVQHDLRRAPLPFRDEEFDFVMSKDLSMIISSSGMEQAQLMDECLRVLKPGGYIEFWDGDHSLRMLLPHAPPSTKEGEEETEGEGQVYTSSMGTYALTTQTPLAAPRNIYLNEYNGWITKALDKKNLSPMPCTVIMPMLHQESELLTDIESRRLVIPLGEVRWEREGVGGAVTPGLNGHAISSKGKGKEMIGVTLTPVQIALRRTALMTVIQMIESLEPVLREASGKSQSEWDTWQERMTKDLLSENGTAWGECLEVGAWWARKR